MAQWLVPPTVVPGALIVLVLLVGLLGTPSAFEGPKTTVHAVVWACFLARLVPRPVIVMASRSTLHEWRRIVSKFGA
jgi:NhaP-type Na+/H+ and K+/H+ antiporter